MQLAGGDAARIVGRDNDPRQEREGRRRAVTAQWQGNAPDRQRQLTPVLRHPDERTQRAAMVAIMESRSPARSLIFAEALPYLHPRGS